LLGIEPGRAHGDELIRPDGLFKSRPMCHCLRELGLARAADSGEDDERLGLEGEKVSGDQLGGGNKDRAPGDTYKYPGEPARKGMPARLSDCRRPRSLPPARPRPTRLRLRSPLPC